MLVKRPFGHYSRPSLLPERVRIAFPSEVSLVQGNYERIDGGFSAEVGTREAARLGYLLQNKVRFMS